ncbi:MAG: DUF5723 family protein [Culturomica sp.]|jgi:hypothetical protein|nr:DUF5723 family protein [Culturomica sp.]
MKRIFYLFVFCLSIIQATMAQSGDATAYFLPNLPQRVNLNPAYQPEYKVWIGLPVLSGISLNYWNTSFAIDNILVKGDNDSLYVDIDKMYKKLRKHNTAYINSATSLFAYGMKINKWYFTLDISGKNDFAVSLDKGIFTFLKEGNASYIGKTFDFGGIALNSSAYTEVALGLSKQVNDRLSVGGRAKFLLGTANIDVKKSDISIASSVDDYTLRLSSKQELRITAPVTFTYTKDNQYVNWDDFDADFSENVSDYFNTDNPGFAVDLGAQYKLNEKINLFASVVDLGFIRWKGNYHFSQDAVFDWKGADISNSLDNGDADYKSLDDVFDDLVDSLKNSFRLVDGNGSYTHMLNSKLFLGASYDLNRTFTAGGLLRLSLVNQRLLPTFTASMNARLLRNVSLSVAPAVSLPGSFDVGAGITAKAGPLQLYVATDNLLAANYTSAKAVSLRFGVNLLFGNTKKVKKVKEEEVLPVVPMVTPVKQVADTLNETLPKEDNSPIEDTLQSHNNLLDSTANNSKIEEIVIYKEETRIISMNYHVVVGSFNKKSNAKRTLKKLENEGFDSSLIQKNENGMYRVIALSFETEAEAEQAIAYIKDKYPDYKDAWVLNQQL